MDVEAPLPETYAALVADTLALLDAMRCGAVDVVPQGALAGMGEARPPFRAAPAPAGTVAKCPIPRRLPVANPVRPNSGAQSVGPRPARKCGPSSRVRRADPVNISGTTQVERGGTGQLSAPDTSDTPR